MALGPSGDFAIRNVGRQSLHVNGQEVGPGQEVPLPHLGLVEIGDLHLLFMANHGAVQRALKLSVPESARDKAAKGTPGR